MFSFQTHLKILMIWACHNGIQVDLQYPQGVLFPIDRLNHQKLLPEVVLVDHEITKMVDLPLHNKCLTQALFFVSRYLAAQLYRVT